MEQLWLRILLSGGLGLAILGIALIADILMLGIPFCIVTGGAIFFALTPPDTELELEKLIREYSNEVKAVQNVLSDEKIKHLIGQFIELLNVIRSALSQGDLSQNEMAVVSSQIKSLKPLISMAKRFVEISKLDFPGEEDREFLKKFPISLSSFCNEASAAIKEGIIPEGNRTTDMLNTLEALDEIDSKL